MAAAAESDKKQALGGLDDAGQEGDIRLISKDQKSFDLLKKNAIVSTLVKTSLDTDPTASEVPIPGVQGELLDKVIEYLNHHNGVEPPIIEKPLRSKIMKEVVKDQWDAIYIDKIGDNNRQQLYDLILAANYMDVKSLLHLGCAKVATLIKGQPLEKIKEILSAGIKKEEEKKE